MFVPLHDDNPLESIRFQYVTFSLILINVAIWVFETQGLNEAVIASFAVIPNQLFQMTGGSGPVLPAGEEGSGLPEWLTLFMYMFLHDNSSVLHLLGNMLFLWVFGDNVEDAMGHGRFLAFYLLCGVFAGLLHAAVANGLFGPLPDLTYSLYEAVPASSIPLIGASGAVAGVIAAYLMLHPYVRVWVLAFRFIPLRISAALALGFWIVLQIVMVLLPGQTVVAYWAHIGGLIAGAVLVLVMRRPGIPLFDRGTLRA